MAARESYGYTIFCDDIRHEQGNKTTFVGAYDQVMYVFGDFPFVLPKFCMAITLNEWANNQSEQIEFLIYMPGDEEDSPSMRGEIPVNRELAMAHPVYQETAESERLVAYKSQLVLAPLAIRDRGFIKVRALCDEKIVRLGTLYVDKGTIDAGE